VVGVLKLQFVIIFKHIGDDFPPLRIGEDLLVTLGTRTAEVSAWTKKKNGVKLVCNWGS
jgi:hypothetical protein